MTEKEIEQMIDSVGHGCRVCHERKLLDKVAADTSRWRRQVDAIHQSIMPVSIALLLILPTYLATAALLPQDKMNVTAGLDRWTATRLADQELTTLWDA